jgi:hypothetical protein
VEAPPRFELGNKGFADLRLTTWLWRRLIFIRRGFTPGENAANLAAAGAVDETRTRDLNLGKVALNQLSYYRRWCLGPESNQRHIDFQSTALPTELPRQDFRRVFNGFPDFLCSFSLDSARRFPVSNSARRFPRLRHEYITWDSNYCQVL